MTEYPRLPNREFKTYKIKWARGILTVRAMIDSFPLGNIVTYTLSVRKDGELIERNTFPIHHGQSLTARIDYWRSIKEDVAQ